MSEKRLNENVCIMMHRKSCAYGEAEFAEPKSPTVKCSAHRSIREAMTPQYVLMVRAQNALCGGYPGRMGQGDEREPTVC
jgi:hypothetical protein